MADWLALFFRLFDPYSPLWIVTALVLGAVLLRWLPYGVASLRGRLRKEESAIDPKLRDKEALEWARRLWRPLLGLGGLAFLFALANLGLSLGFSLHALGSRHGTLSRFDVLQAGLWALGCFLVVWIQVNGIVPWFSPGFRGLAWRLARLSGAARSRARDLLVWVLLALPAIAIALAAARRATSAVSAAQKAPLPSLAVSLLVVGLALLLLRAAYVARSRIVIQPFAVPQGDTALAGMGIEVAARLQHELARIQSLYEVVDEVMPDAANKSPGVTMSVEDIGEIFKEAVGPSSKIKVAGLVEIPIGAIVSAMGLFVRGPRITGSLLREESGDGTHGFLLLAEISGGGRSGSWQVSFEEKRDVQAIFPSEACETNGKPTEDRREPTPPDPGNAKPIDKQPAATGPTDAERAEMARLVDLLACRIFTSLVPSGSPRWQAVRHFTAGLRYYRETQRTPRRKSHLLREAEKEFLLALGEDTQFARCHCNLGVVYHRMELKDAEEAALRQALARDPAAVDAYLGLASLRFDQGQPQSAARHSENGLRIDPWHPRLWNLRGVSLLRQPAKEPETKEPEWKPAGDAAWRTCLPYLGIATALAWRQAVRAEGSGRPALVAKERRVATICLGNLALATASAGKLGPARRLFRHALRLGDDPWWITFELGRALYLAPAKSRAQRLKLLREAGIALDRVYDEALDGESQIELDLYLLGIHLSFMTEDERAEHQESLQRPKAKDAYAYVLDQMAMGGWDEGRMHRLLKDAKKPLKDLDGDATSHFARLRALSRAMPLLNQSAAPSDGSSKAVKDKNDPAEDRFQVWAEALEWLEKKLDGEDLPPEWGEEPATLKPTASLSSVRYLMQILDLDLPSFGDAKEVSEWRRRALELRAQRVADWAWLHAQVRLQRAKTLLESRDGHLAADAADDLEKAIKELYDPQHGRHEHGLQIRDQWLYRCLAEAHLLAALTEKDNARKRTTLCTALEAARKAVAWNPQEPTGFLVLGRVYAALGDWPQAREEWEKALSFGSTPDIWLAITETYLGRTPPPTLQGAETASELMDRMHFLREGLDQVESRPAGDQDGKWLRAHGAIHLCLGLAQLDLGLNSEAATNLSTARAMGCCPIDASIALAKTHAGLKKGSEVNRDLEVAEEELKALTDAQEWMAANERIRAARRELDHLAA